MDKEKLKERLGDELNKARLPRVADKVCVIVDEEFKKEGYMYGGTDEGSYYCQACDMAHHKLSCLGQKHLIHRRFRRD